MLEWSSLTRIEPKYSLYREETYFRESAADLYDTFGGESARAAYSVALLMVKPDGIAARKVAAVLEFLGDNDFTVLAVRRTSLAGAVWRELWRYQLNAATLDRLLVNEIVLAGESLLLLLRYDGSQRELPAAVLLSELKGPADVTRQKASCLRRRLAQPNRVFSLVHVANEPADVLRELGVLLSRQNREHVLAALRDGALPESDRAMLAEALEQDRRPAQDFDPCASADRISRAVHEGAHLAQPPAREVLAVMDQVRAGEPIQWRPFARALAAAGIAVQHWDLATVGASCITYDEPGRVKTIENVDPARWQPLRPVRDERDG
jgi:hypothetical protein